MKGVLWNYPRTLALALATPIAAEMGGLDRNEAHLVWPRLGAVLAADAWNVVKFRDVDRDARERLLVGS